MKFLFQQKQTAVPLKFYSLMALALVFISEEIFSCSVCMGGFSKEKLDAYLYTGISLTALPFFFLGIMYLLFKIYKKKPVEDLNQD